MKKTERLETAIKQLMSLFVVLLILIYSSFRIPNVSAQDATDSAQEASESSGLTGSIKEKLEEIKKEVASKAASLRGEASKKTLNKAFIGKASAISETSMTVETKNGNRTVYVNEYTKFENSAKTKRTLRQATDFVSDDFIAVLGDVDDKNIMTAKKIVRIDPVASASARFVWGMIQSVSNPKIAVIDREDKTISITSTPSTIYYLGKEEASILDAKPNRYLVARGTQKDTTFTASFIYFIPTHGITKPEKKESSSSATPSATPKR